MKAFVRLRSLITLAACLFPSIALADQTLPVEMPEDIDVFAITKKTLEEQGQKLIRADIIYARQTSMAEYYPSKAISDKIQGESAVICQFDYATDGHMKNCLAIYEIPDAYGFAQAAVDVALNTARVDVSKIKPEDSNAYVLMRYNWRLDDIRLLRKK